MALLSLFGLVLVCMSDGLDDAFFAQARRASPEHQGCSDALDNAFGALADNHMARHGDSDSGADDLALDDVFAAQLRSQKKRPSCHKATWKRP